MTFYFLMIGLEIKHELVEGELSSWKKRSLPGLGAIGGIILPALIYIFINRNTEIAIKGWAIPTATDIAFTLGILSLIGSNFPPSLKLFFTALAIIDDFFAVIITAVFYTKNIDVSCLSIAIAIIFLLIVFNRLRIFSLTLYVLFGAILWHFMFKSGVHATFFGFIFSLVLPYQTNNCNDKNKLSFYFLEDILKYFVNLLILPTFIFINAGFSISIISNISIFDPVVLGIMMGLFIGKQAGIFLFSFIAVKIGVGIMPKNSNWHLIYGGSALCGIGFTMSLFLTLCSFPQYNDLQEKAKLGIISASIASIIFAYFILRAAKYKKTYLKI
ncbi:Na+/H+ antiporter NhaA [Candidatus Liberibacter americanus PW_SP]|nr:Na+/H+ antiporter NhaA [Candidatus Liberibacter americanus PW_SP]